MKLWGAIAALAILVTAVAAILWVRTLDPRPAANELRVAFAAAQTELAAQLPADASALSGEPDADFVTLMVPYQRTMVAVAEAALGRVADANLRDFAERVVRDGADNLAALDAWRGQHAAGAAVAAAAAAEAYAAASGATLEAVATGVTHVGTPDEMFIQVMLPLQQGAVALADAQLAASTDMALRQIAGDMALMLRGATGSMQGWLASHAHSH